MEEYKKKITDMIAEAKKLIEEGKVEEAEKVTEEIKNAKEKHEKEMRAKAELAALSGAALGKGLETFGGVSESGKEIDDKKKQAAIYDRAWKKLMHGDSLSAEEKKVVKIVNETATTKENELLVPETYRDGIWSRIEKEHPLLADVVATHVKGKLTIIKDTDDSDESWYAETDTVSEDGLSETSITLGGCEVAKDIQISWKLKKMSVDELANHIQKKLAKKLGKALAKGVAKGAGPDTTVAGKDEPVGVITALLDETNTPQVVEVEANAEVEYTTLTAAFAKIDSGYDKVIYASNETIWNTLANILDNNGRPIFIPSETSGFPGRILGVPVKEEHSTILGKNEILIGDLADGYAWNVNEDMTMYTEDSMKPRTTDYMIYAIVDGAVIDTKAFAYIKKNSQ